MVLDDLRSSWCYNGRMLSNFQLIVVDLIAAGCMLRHSLLFLTVGPPRCISHEGMSESLAALACRGHSSQLR